ncbi:MAG: glutamate--tRNA ligase [Euryarchaeota archaeon RBG_16_67_27]|nr:MAG: glutamate--tRNA ligase [Euryarchaeota archaeon RBG_16_67_27]
MPVESARKYALQNAVLHGGKADPKAVLGKLLAEDATLRSRAKELAAEIARTVDDVNRLELEAQKAELAALAPELLERPKAETGPKELPPLPDAVEGNVVLRLAPYPSGPLHIGNARAFVLNDAYAKRYRGKLLLVFDDTIGSEEKPLLPEAFDQVKEGLDWAGVEYHEVLYKSDRIPIHYEWGERLIATGEAYVCECDAETLRRNRETALACVHRSQDVDETLAMWKAMLAGTYGEGEAVVRLKTDVAHPNPAFRDRVLFRVAEREHPRVGARYRVWPMLEFSWAVDDHLLGVTHVIRGKDLIMEDLMETRIWDLLEVARRPRFVHFGILRFKDLELSKSRYRREIAEGRLTGIDDPRTWSLQSLMRRGIRPAALREFVLSFGLSQSDIEVAAETLYAENRKRIDKDANRYFFVPEPVPIAIEGLPPVSSVKAPLHPDFPGRGERTLPVDGKVAVARADFEKFRGQEVRLKDFCNVRLDRPARFLSMENRDIPKIQWVDHGVTTVVLMPSGFESRGLAEPAVADLRVDTVVQFERVGFVRIDRVSRAEVRACFAHR